jgi:cysteine desulfurase / selenocysteine lyase
VWRPAVRALGESRVRLLPGDATGRIDLAALERLDTRGALGVVLQHASNVCGVVQPVAEVGAWCLARGLPLVIDAAQSAGLVPIGLERIAGLAACTMAGHKYLGGAPGIGVAWFAAGFDPPPLWIGGNGVDSELPRIPDTGPARYESGTPNLPGIAALERALAWFDEHPAAESFARHGEIRADWRDRLAEIRGLELVGEGGGAPRTPVISLCIPGLDPNELAVLLEAEVGARCRAGLHCAPLAHRHLGTIGEGGTMRIAPGLETTAEERDRVLAALRVLAARS